MQNLHLEHSVADLARRARISERSFARKFLAAKAVRVYGLRRRPLGRHQRDRRYRIT